MAFDFYKAPEAPAPDWSSLVRARLGKTEARQAAVNALMQMAQENQKLQAAKEQHAAALAMEQHQLDAAKEYHSQEIAARGREIDRQLTHDTMQAGWQQARTDSMTERETMRENARAQRDEQTNKLRDLLSQRHDAFMQQQAQAHQDLIQQKIQEASDRNEAFHGALSALSHPPEGQQHEFSALETLPFYSPDGSKVTATLRNMKGVGGENETAEDVYNNLSKAKHTVTVPNDPDWFQKAIEPFAGHLTPKDQEDLFKASHADEYARSPAEAREKAVKFFSGGEFKPYFQGQSAEAMNKPGETAGDKANRSMMMAKYRANLQFANIPITDKTDELTKTMVQNAKAENDAIQKQYGGDQSPAPAPGGQPAPAPAPAPQPQAPQGGGGVLSPDEQKALDDLYGGTQPH